MRTAFIWKAAGAECGGGHILRDFQAGAGGAAHAQAESTGKEF